MFTALKVFSCSLHNSATSKEVIDSLNNYVKDKKASLLIATHDENFTKISDQNLIIDSGII